MKPSTTLGDYLLLEIIGAGGMAAVYKAVDERTNTVVALKVLSQHWSAQASGLKRFWREAEITQKLRHPNIVPIIDYGQVNGKAYIAMPFMAGGSLADFFRYPTNVSLQFNINLLRQIADGLDYAHLSGVIHRDLKLANILLDEHRRAALADFGIAHLSNATRLTMTGAVAGTPLYMSPEQAQGMSDVDYRADLYSFAVMAYLMITGYHPFTGEDPLAILHRHLFAVAPKPSAITPKLPKAMDDVFVRGLAKIRDQRYKSASEFVDAIDHAFGNQYTANHTLINMEAPNPIVAEITMDLPSTISNRNKRAKRRGALVASFLIPLIAVLSAIVFVFRPQNTPSPALDESSAATRIVGEITQTWVAISLLFTDTPTPTLTFTNTPTPTLTFTATATPTLTQTTTPTLTLTPDATQYRFGAAEIIAPNGADLFRIPFDQAGIITHLAMGTRLELIGGSSDHNWYEVRTLSEPQLRGWIRVQYVNLAAPDEPVQITWYYFIRTLTTEPQPDDLAIELQPTATSSGSGGNVIASPTTQLTNPSAPTTQATQTSAPSIQATNTSMPTTQPTNPPAPTAQPTNPPAPTAQPTNPPPPPTAPGNSGDAGNPPAPPGGGRVPPTPPGGNGNGQP
jgi:serine/threonine-protein kinase